MAICKIVNSLPAFREHSLTSERRFNGQKFQGQIFHSCTRTVEPSEGSSLFLGSRRSVSYGFRSLIHQVSCILWRRGWRSCTNTYRNIMGFPIRRCTPTRLVTPPSCGCLFTARTRLRCHCQNNLDSIVHRSNSFMIDESASARLTCSRRYRGAVSERK